MEVVTYAHPIAVGEEEVSVLTFSIESVVLGVGTFCVLLYTSGKGHSPSVTS